MKRFALLVALIAVTLVAGPAWGQCVTVCETGDDEVTVRVYDDEGEPYTLARVELNEYENIFFVVDDGDGNVCVVDTWAEDLEPADVIDDDGYMVVDLTDEAVWIYGEYPGWEAFLEMAEFWGAGVEGGSGDPDPEWSNVLNYRLDGEPTFGDWLDAGSASNDGFGCIENPCEPAAPSVSASITGPHNVDVGAEVVLEVVTEGLDEGTETYLWDDDSTAATRDLGVVDGGDTGVYTCEVGGDVDGEALEEPLEASFTLWVGVATPLAGGLGLGLLAGACALAGAVSIRRKK